MVEAGEPLQHGPLQDHAEDADDDGCDDQRPPVADAGEFSRKYAQNAPIM